MESIDIGHLPSQQCYRSSAGEEVDAELSGEAMDVGGVWEFGLAEGHAECADADDTLVLEILGYATTRSRPV